MNHSKNSISGVALVIVLGFLVIISALAVAFFSSVNTEMKASRNFAAGITTRQLADSAVQVVMGQISSAATRGIDTQGVGHEVWASQPGMIRVFGINSGGTYTESDKADAFFKLYSSDQMTVTTKSTDGGQVLAQFNPATDYLQTWDQAPAVWTDLNAPVIVRDVNNTPTPRFPIIDPRAYAYTFDAGADDPWKNDVEGFSYDQSSGVSGVVGPKNVIGGDSSQRLPMPVKWIYVLQDGTLTAPTSTGTTVADFSQAQGGKKPTVQNPIVGRIAFWTDDETSKLNLNTAAGYSDRNISQLNSAYQSTPSAYAGSYWDSPRFYTTFDYGIPDSTGSNPGYGQPAGGQASGGLALCQLLQFEFQRYPGHPATTSLAPVLDTLLNSEQIYDTLPRYTTKNLQGQPGSTKGGTVRIVVDPYLSVGQNPPGNTPPDPTANSSSELQPKQDRLYASVDEYLYGAHSTGNLSSSPSYTRMTNNKYAIDQNGPDFSPISPQVVDRLRFFVTTQGRAPELNVFGQPRISCWPVRSETDKEPSGLNVYDNLVLFCSTVGATASGTTASRPNTSVNGSATGVYRYIFVRREVSPTASPNYLSQFTRTDFLGNAQKQYEFTSAYTPDWQLPLKGQSSRNTELLQNYLYGNGSTPGLTDRKIPGNGNKFSDKYSAADRQGILTEIFDYIRLANSQDTTFSITPTTPPTQTIKFAPRGMVAPSLPSFFTAGGTSNPVKGFGRMSTICEATLDFYYAGPIMNPKANYVPIETVDTNFTPIAGAASNDPTKGALWSRWDPAAPTSRYVYTLANQKMDTGYVYATDAAGKALKQSELKKPFGYYMRAFVLFSTFDPMQGYAPKSDPATNEPKMSIECQWKNDFFVNLTGTPIKMGFPQGGPVATTIYRAPGSVWGGRNYGGYEGFAHTLAGYGDATRPYKTSWAPNTPLTAADFGMNWTPNVTTFNAGSGMPMPQQGKFVNVPFTQALMSGNTFQEYYPFQTLISNAIAVPSTATSFTFQGADVIVKLFYGGSSQNTAFPPLQTFTLTFPTSPIPWPLPRGQAVSLNDCVPFSSPNTAALTPPTADVSTWLSVKSTDANNFGTSPQGLKETGTGGIVGMQHYYWMGNGSFFANSLEGVRAQMSTGMRGQTAAMTSLQASWSFATRLAWMLAGRAPGDTSSSGDSYDPHTNSGSGPTDPGGGAWMGDRWRCIVQPGDTVRSLLYWDGNNTSNAKMSGIQQTTGGDLRIGALTANVPAAEFQPHPDYFTGNSRACVLRAGDGNSYFPVGAVQAALVGTPTGTSSCVQTAGAPAVVLADASDSSHEASLGNHILLSGSNKMPLNRAFGNLPWGGGTTILAGVNGVDRRESGGGGKFAGDFDTGLGDFPDGPFCNKQDEGNVIYRYWDGNLQRWIYPIPYFTNTQSYQAPGNVFTSPSRQMPSPAMFGSLPSTPSNGGAGGLHWTTLAFSPNTAGDEHPGNKEPKDHYLLDLFQMPVVEPYPISEPFSTAGKVNLNYRIVPFDYIRRSTALRGALYPLRITAVSNGYYATYKTGSSGSPLSTNFRLRLDRDETVKAFDGFFDSAVGNPDTGFFKVASQICERWLYPKDGTAVHYSGTPAGEANIMRNWWSTNGDLTGDNEREKPYVDLYPRITTKSNTFTVHMKVQTLRQTPGHPTQWIEGKDTVLGEYRGSSTIERYIDPADPRFTPGAASTTINPDNQSVEPMYRFRVVINKKFTP